ncbi:MAG: TIGR04255 family protein [Rhodospirillales bacterium]|nr:MAG: TIGR04255 family protein [Rhodospirillales bacterium]
MTEALAPLTGPSPTEVHLPRAPLVRVIAQVRFEPILAIRLADRVATFQEIVRGKYPFLKEDRVHQVEVALGPAVPPQIKEAILWRFSDQEEQVTWRVSLGVDFVALETTAYESRDNFLQRLREIVDGVEAVFKPQEVRRFGLRYIDRLTGDAMLRASDLIRAEVLGIAQGRIGGAARHILTETILDAEEGVIQARWGRLPPKATIDPNAIEPIDEPSWLLDLDMSTRSKQSFDGDGISKTATAFAERIYTVFRWMVTTEFLRFYGGKP